MAPPKSWRVQEEMLSTGRSTAGVHYVEEKTLMVVSGACIKVASDAALGAPANFIQCPSPHGVSCAAASWRSRVFAFAEKALKPAIYVHTFPGLELACKLEGGADLEVCALSFARNKSWLVSLSLEPDLSFVVWDWKAGAQVARAQAVSHCLAMAVNPADAAHTAMITRSVLTLWHVREVYDKHIVEFVDVAPPVDPGEEDAARSGGERSPPFATAAGDGGGDDARFTALAWAADGGVYAASTTCALHCFAAPDGTERADRRTMLPGVADALAITRAHVVASCGDAVHWIEMQSGARCMVVRVGARTTALELSPQAVSILAECDDGGVRKLIVTKPELVPTSPDAARAAAAALAQAEDEGRPRPVGAAPDDAVSLVSIGAGHAGAIRGMGCLPAMDADADAGPPPCVITCGEDRVLRSWDVASAELLQAEALPRDSQPRALAVSRAANLVAIGTAAGVLRVYRRAPTGALKAVLVKRYSNVAVTALAWDAEGARLAAAHADGSVAFVSAFQALRSVGVGAGAVGAEPLSLTFVGAAASARLLVGCADSTVVRLTPPALSAEPADDLSISRAALKPRATKLPARARALAPAPRALGEKALLAACADGSVRLYAVADDDYGGGALAGDASGGRPPPAGEGAAALAAMVPHAGPVVHQHETACTALDVGADGRQIVSGSEAGALIVTDVAADQSAPGEWRMGAHGATLGGCAAVGILVTSDQATAQLLSAGRDGVLYIAEVLNTSAAPADLGARTAPNDLSTVPISDEAAAVADADVPLELDAVVAAVPEAEAERRASERGRMQLKLDGIREQLDTLLANNAAADDLERLPNEELIVDEKLREDLAAEADVDASELKAQARRDNLRKLYLWERMKEEFVEPMETPGAALEPLPVAEVEVDALAMAGGGPGGGPGPQRKSMAPVDAAATTPPPPATVHSFALRKPSDRGQRQRRAVALLREVELRERAWLAAERVAEEELGGTAFEDPESVAAVIGEVASSPSGADEGKGTATPAAAAAAAAAAEADAEADAGADGGDGDDADGAGDDGGDGAADGAAGAGDGAGGASDVGGGADPAPDRAAALIAAADAAGRQLTTRELCYAPYDLYTERRKIAQTVLRGQLVEQTKAAFNGEFQALLAHKRKELERIAEKDVRVEEICGELGFPSLAYRPALSEAEEPERRLAVQDDEMHAKRWESPEERAKREAAERAAAERAAAADADNAARRALAQMMHGTLERRKDDELAEDVVKPQWMVDIPQEEMTEEELAQVRDFEARVKKIEEEREKVRKGLQAELLKLLAETADICKAFNARLQALGNHKLDVSQAVYELELTIIKLAQSQARGRAHVEREASMVAELARLRSRRAETAQAKASFAARVDKAHEVLEKAENENRIRGNEKTFRQREFADAPEFVDALWRLFKKREVVTVRADIAGDDADAGGNDAADLLVAAANKSGTGTTRMDLETVEGVAESDPFLAADRAAIPRRDEIAKLDPGEDMPEGMSFSLWDRLERLRADKITKEEEVAERRREVDHMESYLRELELADEDVELSAAQLEIDLEAFREMREKEVWDMEIPLKLKQGQIEVEQAAVVTDFANALFVHRGQVQQLNSEIKRLGGEKVEILTEIRDFRKGIAELLWDNERLGMEADDLVDRTREFQLLRVTKDLQKLMKGSGEDTQSAEVLQLERKLEAMTASHESRVTERERQLKKMLRLKAEKDTELDRLRTQIKALEATVSERETIAQIQSASGDDHQDAASRIRHVHMQRKLKSLIHMQTQEIDLLREELDRLRRRTFPTFAHYEQARRQPAD